MTADKPTYLVFGADGGIGQRVVHHLIERDASVVAGVRDRNAGTASDSRVHRVECDVTDPSQVAAAFDAAREFGGGTLDGVALCVGSILLKPAHLTTDEEWATTVAKNLSAAFYVARSAGKTMRDGGSVVFCSSAAASVGLPNHDAIAAAKAGIEGLVRSASATYASRGLRFHAVAPGLVDTPLAAAVTSHPKSLETSIAMHPLGRIGSPDEVARAIDWLLDPRNSWISGDVLRVDGGLATLRRR